MGQEFAASSPFLFFTDFPNAELSKQVHEGRKQFLAQFPSFASLDAQAAVPDPCDPAVFQRSKLDLSERRRHAEWYALHRTYYDCDGKTRSSARKLADESTAR